MIYTVVRCILEFSVNMQWCQPTPLPVYFQTAQQCEQYLDQVGRETWWGESTKVTQKCYRKPTWTPVEPESQQ